MWLSLNEFMFWTEKKIVNQNTSTTQNSDKIIELE